MWACRNGNMSFKRCTYTLYSLYLSRGYRNTLRTINLKSTGVKSSQFKLLEWEFQQPPVPCLYRCFNISNDDIIHGRNDKYCWGLLAFMGLFLKREEEEEDDDEIKIPLSVKRCILNAQRAKGERDYETAEREYHTAIELLQSSPNASSQPYVEATAVVVDSLGNMYLEMGELEKAELNFKSTIHLMLIAGVQSESSPIVELSLKLAKIYSNMKKYADAETGFHWCMTTAQRLVDEEKTEENLALLGMCQHGTGQYYMITKDYQSAFLYFSQALATGKAIYGNEDMQIVTLMSDCATALEGLGKFDEAEQVMEHALSLMETLQTNDEDFHELMTRLLMNFGAIVNNKGNSVKAVNLYNRALAQSKKLTTKEYYYEIRSRLDDLSQHKQ